MKVYTATDYGCYEGWGFEPEPPPPEEPSRDSVRMVTLAEANERISFLERAALDIQRDVAEERRDHANLKAAYAELNRRYDLLMQRKIVTKTTREFTGCCDDYPECGHNR